MKSICFFATATLLQIAYVKREYIKTVSSPIFNRVLVWLGVADASSNKIKPPVDMYIEKHTNRFLKTYDTTDMYNENIDKCFYDKEALIKILVDANNRLEVEWKRRLLYESTPRGNLIMYYDPYKLGFVYYSDISVISITILNMVAMKYCLTYRCRDFFVDNEITPHDKHSVLIPIHYIEQPKKQNNDENKNKTSIVDTSAFAKFKKYNKQTEKANETNKTKTDLASNTVVQKPKDVCRNRFIYMGKMINMQFLQPIKKYTNKLNGFSSSHLTNLEGETQLQKTVLSYKDFKINKNK